jgi:hypothetical protein
MRFSLALIGTMAVAAAVVPGLRKKSLNQGPPPARSWRMRITSHETFTHDSLDSLGYDWGRIADPTVAPRFPFKVYMPQSVDDLVRAVREARQLGEKLVVRSKGHSSNDLVFAEGGAMLVMEKLDRVLDIDSRALTATVEAGAISAQLDDRLATMGLGLPVIGDHNDISVGGFASAGGISPASHRYGLFIDNVLALDYVTWDGEVVHCSPTENAADFWRVLAGTGQHGIIARMTLKLIEIDKYGTVLENDQTTFRSFEEYVDCADRNIADPGDALYFRGVWADYRIAGRRVGIGQVSRYGPTEESTRTRLRNRLAYGYLHRLGYLGGRLPPGIDRTLKYLGSAAIIWSPRYASIKNIEFFADKILDATVGDPTRMLIVLAPSRTFKALCTEAFELMAEYREETGCFTFISAYVKAINSPYLAKTSGDGRYSELTFYVGVKGENMTTEVLDELVSRLDDICIKHQGYRYMHTRTVTDERRAKIDPNAYYVTAGKHGAGADGQAVSGGE